MKIKFQTPSSKLQKSLKSQAPIRATQRLSFGERGIWDLELGDSLELGTWSLGFRNTAVRDRLRKKSPANRAFTLIELMVVIVLIGIVSAVIVPEMKGTYEEALLRSTSRDLVSAFNLAYSQAVAGNQLHRVRLDKKGGRYFVEKIVREREEGGGFVPLRDVPGGEGDLDTRISIEFRRHKEEPSKEREQEAPLVFEDDARSENGEEAISFYPDGTADPGEVLLRDREGFRLSLRINPTTARVRVVELERE